MTTTTIRYEVAIDARSDKSAPVPDLLAGARWLLDSTSSDYQALGAVSDDIASDGCYTVYRITLNNAVAYAHRDYNDNLLISLRDVDSTIADELSEWDLGDLDLATHLASFGLIGAARAALDRADEDYTGVVRVWRSLDYCGDTLSAPIDGYLRKCEITEGAESGGEIATWPDYAAALAWIDEQRSVRTNNTIYTICRD